MTNEYIIRFLSYAISKARETKDGIYLSFFLSIKRIIEDLERVTAERDAAIEDLKKVPLCHCCKHIFEGNYELCSECSKNVGYKWEWRGVI